MRNKWKLILQLFGDGGDGAAASGAEGGDTGSNPADAGRARLMELGVPEGRLSKNRQYNLPQQRTPKATEAAEAAAENRPASGAETTPIPTDGKRMTFDEIAKDPEYSKELSKLVNNRLKSAKDAEAKLQSLQPALEVLSRHYGMDMAALDYGKLAEAVNGDSSYYQQIADERGVTEEIAMQLDQQEREIARRKQLDDIFQQRQQFDNHLSDLHAQAEKLKAIYPSFDLDAELRDNERFRRMTAPGGVSVEDAYFALHHQEIQAASMQTAVQKTMERASASIQAGAKRPQEAGASSQAPSVTTFNYAKASAADRARIRAEMQRAAANGQKVTPSMFYGK